MKRFCSELNKAQLISGKDIFRKGYIISFFSRICHPIDFSCNISKDHACFHLPNGLLFT